MAAWLVIGMACISLRSADTTGVEDCRISNSNDSKIQIKCYPNVFFDLKLVVPLINRSTFILIPRKQKHIGSSARQSLLIGSLESQTEVVAIYKSRSQMKATADHLIGRDV